jgi:hypothetical protein
LSGFGVLGFHRFYLGKLLSGILWMFTFGLAGIGSLYDLFTLDNQVDQANELKATYLPSRWRPGLFRRIERLALCERDGFDGAD